MDRPASLRHVKADWLRVKSEAAHVRMLVLGQRYVEALWREAKYSPDQPRVPAGNSDGGQWTSGSGGSGGAGEAGSSRSDTGDKPVQLVLAPVIAEQVAEKAAEVALYLYLYWASQNSQEKTAVLEFNAQEFLPGVTADEPAIGVRRLSRDDVDEACPRHGEVQSLTDDAADRVKREGNYYGAAAYGTKVHTAIRTAVNSMLDPNFRAEVSAIKSKEENYGVPGTIRVDVLENVGNGTVCVYDIKTGKSKLTLPRMFEIASNVHSRYTGTKRILVIETRPLRGK